MPRRILITGASVAGNTVAWWLARAGHDVTVAERAPEFRDGGQNIDVRGVGREVLRRMGLEQAALQQGTGEEGTAWVEEDGTVAAQFLIADTGVDGPTAEMEILRGDLARLPYEPASEHATYRFGDSIARVEQNDDGACVTFASGTVERYNLIVVAEGVGSRTRELVFPGENEPRWMDLTIAYLTVPRRADDDRLWRWYDAPGGRSVSLRPDRHGTARAMLSMQEPHGDEQNWETNRQKAWLRERFADAGSQTDRVHKSSCTFSTIETSAPWSRQIGSSTVPPCWPSIFLPAAASTGSRPYAVDGKLTRSGACLLPRSSGSARCSGHSAFQRSGAYRSPSR